MPDLPPPGWLPPGDPAHPGTPGASGAPGAPQNRGHQGDAAGAGQPWLPPVHRPGVIALRPLTLGDLFDGAFKTIRRNPGAMVGLAAAVTALFLVVPTVVTLALAAAGDLSSGFFDAVAEEGGAGDLNTLSVVSNLGSVFAVGATVLLNGMLVKVVAEAVLGRRTTAGQAWAATRGRLVRLVGLVLLNFLLTILLIALPVALGVLVGLQAGVGPGLAVGVPSVLLAVVVLVFVQIRYFLLAAPALMLERIGIAPSLRRSAELSRDQFWRLFGIYLLTALVVGLVSQVVAVPLSLLGVGASFVFPGTGGALALVFSNYFAQLLIGATTTPFTAAVVALQYIDQRIRKEGLDVALIAAAQQLPQQSPPSQQPRPGWS